MPPKIVSKDSTYVSPLQQLQTKTSSSGKRIRVARACDNCRRRKVKCDGKQPCIHCTVYSYECTYNYVKQPAVPNKKVKRETEEKTVDQGKLSQQMISLLFPEVNISDSNFNLDLFVQIFEKHKHNGIIDLKTIMQDYNSTSEYKISRSLDPVEIKIILPPKDIAIKLIYRTWNDACQLFRFYHRPSFIRDVNSLYETNPNEYSNHQNKMLPLVYSVIAVGALFSKGDNAIDNQYLQDEGYRYFIASRKLIDITNSTDLESIQTIFMLTLFLQCSARLSTCYSYIGIALRSALRQGLHRKLETKCSYVKAECKKRLFWTIYKMEIYVNSMLGLPNSINESDIDAELPLDIDDSNIDFETITPQVRGKLSSCGINNSHTKLILILNHIVQKLYKSSNPLYITPVEIIKNLENELKIWSYELPSQLKPNENCPPEYLKANKLLHLDYLHVQIMLYRPFIHYVKMTKSASTKQENNYKTYQYENGLKCFEVSKEIISLAEEMINEKLLNGSYWFSIYTIFFSVACLVYYFLEIDSTNKSVNEAIERGKLILSSLKQRSVSAERIYNLLNHMFENYDRNNLKLDDLNLNNDSPVNQQQAKSTPSPLSGEQKSSYPLNSFTSPTGDNLINLPATHTVDGIEKQQGIPSPRQLSTPQSLANININPQSYIPNGVIDDFDLRIFGKFFPSELLEQQQPTKSESAPANGISGNFNISKAETSFSSIGLRNGETVRNLDEENSGSIRDPNWINPLELTEFSEAAFGKVPGSTGAGSHSGRSVSGSIKTDDDEHVFDWERFFNKSDNMNFDI